MTVSQMCTATVGIVPVGGRDHAWSFGADSGFVTVDLRGDWNAQVDPTFTPEGWERVTDWSVRGDSATAGFRLRRESRAVARVDTAFGPLRARHRAENVRVLSQSFGAMRADVQSRKDAGLKKLVAKDWADKLAAVILERNMATATEVAQRVIHALRPKAKRVLADDQDFEDYDPTVMEPWLTINASIAGAGVAQRVQDMLDEADDSEDDDTAADPVSHVFDILMLTGAAEIAQRMVTSSAGFATRDAAHAAGGESAKSWQVNSGNPRSSHAALNGETVPLNENFSNGMAWPGDPEGGPDENANCQCSLTINRG